LKSKGVNLIICDALAQFVCQNKDNKYSKIKKSIDICNDIKNDFYGCLIPNVDVPNVEIIMEIDHNAFIEDIKFIHDVNTITLDYNKQNDENEVYIQKFNIKNIEDLQ